MAMSHFLTCPTCLDKIGNPCTLSCDHTFCVECVVKYTHKYVSIAMSEGSLLCRKCQSLTKVPDPSRPVEEWTRQLRTSFQRHDLTDKTSPRTSGAADYIPSHEEYRGKITVIKNGVLQKLSKPVLSKTIYCKRKPDGTSPNIFDVVHMSVHGTETLIFADRWNSCIKSFFTNHNRSCHSRLELHNYPCRIARIEGNKLAVTLDSSEKIMIFTASPDLSMLTSIPVRKRYVGLTALTPTTLAVSPRSPPCVDIIDLSGNVLKSISPLKNGQSILHDPLFLCTTKQGLILVSDTTVVCLTPQGEVVFNYYPRGGTALHCCGITCTEMGDILVADGLHEKVIHLNELGQFVGEILTSRDGLRDPYIIGYDSGTIYVSHCSTIQEFTLT